MLGEEKKMHPVLAQTEHSPYIQPLTFCNFTFSSSVKAQKGLAKGMGGGYVMYEAPVSPLWSCLFFLFSF